jgi:hypothetical protein
MIMVAEDKLVCGPVRCIDWYNGTASVLVFKKFFVPMANSVRFNKMSPRFLISAAEKHHTPMPSRHS